MLPINFKLGNSTLKKQLVHSCGNAIFNDQALFKTTQVGLSLLSVNTNPFIFFRRRKRQQLNLSSLNIQLSLRFRESILWSWQSQLLSCELDALTPESLLNP